MIGNSIFQFFRSRFDQLEQRQFYHFSHESVKEYFSTLDRYMKRLYNQIIHNAKKRAKQIDVKITIDDIKELYDKQDGKCAITGEELTHLTYTIKGNQHIINEWNISVDRIDSNKDYTKDNIQLVGAIVNRMKTDLSNEKFLEICNKAIKNNKQT